MRKVSFLLGIVLLSGLLLACGDATPTTVPVTTAPATSSASAVTLNDGLITNFVLATQSGDYQKIYDATPDLSGSTVYFTSSNSKGSGVFKAPAAGGAATEVFVGSPFVAARTLAFSPDGQQLFIADPSAQSNGKTGLIFSLPVNGGTPAPLTGSAGTAPQNLDIVSQNGQTNIYFSGKDLASGQPALLKLPASGAETVSIVAKGTPLVEPDGVAVNQAGVIYLSDRSGKVFKVENGNATAIVNRLVTGNPAGIALSPDQSVLMVSAQKEGEAAAQVLLVDTKTLQTGLVTKGVSQNPVAGGLHSSPDRTKGAYAWSGVTVGNGRGGSSYSVGICARMCLTDTAIACCK